MDDIRNDAGQVQLPNNATCRPSKRKRSSQEHCAQQQKDMEVGTGDRVVGLAAVQSVLVTREHILDFQHHHQHSLRLSASNVAAMAGLNPYKNLVELAMQLVYQGRLGQALLAQDAAILGLRLVSDDVALMELANKAGAGTQAALQSALRVKNGSEKLDSIERANQVKATVLQEAQKAVAAGKLSAPELEVLQEGVRSAVDTGYGTSNEDDALDHYQKKVGWEVLERNEEVRVWKFELAPLVKGSSHQPYDEGLTVVPMGKAETLKLKTSSEAVIGTTEVIVLDSESDGEDATTITEIESTTNLSLKMELVSGENTEKPFFCILGSIDGIREEMIPVETEKNSESPSEDSWVLRRIVVECKHRMRRIQSTPPIYEQIQAMVYCFMFDAEEADIVQVLRQQKAALGKDEAGPRSTPATPKKPKDSCVRSNRQSIKQWMKPLSPISSENNNSPETLTTTSMTSKDSLRLAVPPLQPPPILSITRISLDDPIMQHPQQWTETVLPRIRSFVQAVYTIRSDDNKRYRFLLSASSGADVSPTNAATIRSGDAWDILHGECPWLLHCDTAYYRRRNATVNNKC